MTNWDAKADGQPLFIMEWREAGAFIVAVSAVDLLPLPGDSDRLVMVMTDASGTQRPIAELDPRAGAVKQEASDAVTQVLSATWWRPDPEVPPQRMWPAPRGVEAHFAELLPHEITNYRPDLVAPQGFAEGIWNWLERENELLAALAAADADRQWRELVDQLVGRYGETSPAELARGHEFFPPPDIADVQRTARTREHLDARDRRLIFNAWLRLVYAEENRELAEAP